MAADVAIAIQTLNKEEIGIIVLPKEVHLLITELPVVTNISMGNHDLAKIFSPLFPMSGQPLFEILFTI